MPPTKVGWQSRPNVRGTPDLLFSCATTLFLCAWTAYHPNIPTGRGKRSRLAHRFVWMLIAVAVPEFVLWCASEQWWAARKLRQSVNAILLRENTEISGDERKECRVCKEKDEELEAQSVSAEVASVEGDAEPESENVPEELEIGISRADSGIPTPQKEEVSVKKGEPWTLEQAFFALAGGYVLPPTDPSLPPITLTAKGILLFIQLDIFPSTPPSAISDKSKADAFAKAIVCLQAMWFIVQMIGRAVAKLPITTLEIHVLAHVLCAFAIYAVWFEKGYDVGDPIVVGSEEGQALAALFEMEGLEHSRYRVGTEKCACSSPNIDASITTPSPRPIIRHSSAIYLKWLFSQLIDRPVTRSRTRKLEQCQDGASSYHVARVERVNRALHLLRDHNTHVTYTEETVWNDDVSRTYTIVERGYTVPLRSNLTLEGLGADIKKSRTGFRERQIFTYALIAVFYGAVHLFAINPTHFPTRIEYYLWLSAVIVMMALPLLFVLFLCESSLSPKILNKMDHATIHNIAFKIVHMMARMLSSSISMVLGMTLMFGATCYPVARLYVLVESLAGLRSVDKQVYQTVQWIQWMPHVG